MGGNYKGTSMLAVEMEGISHRFAATWALVDIDLPVGGGESVAILGPNGCGKTTLLKILATLLSPTHGQGTLLGYDIRNGVAQIRNQIEWLGHELGFYDALNVEENLKFALKIRGECFSKTKGREVLERVGMENAGSKPLSSLSAGERKRLALARMLLQRPKLILLDEPHANLDRGGKTLVNDLIAKWQREGTTLFIASHDHPEVLPLCDKILVLNEGNPVYFGQPKGLPQHIKM